MSREINADTSLELAPFASEAEFEEACTRFVKETGALLTAIGAHAAAAESLTGGLISSEIVRVAGSSRWFKEGCVTYTDGAKASRLGVDVSTLAEHTAVSSQVAKQMAEGMLVSSGADIAVSATGLAGPGADELGREPGLVFIGGACKNGCVSVKYNFEGCRTQVRQQAAYAALHLMRSLARLIAEG